MNKLISVLKATMSGDMNIFKVKNQKTSNKRKTMLNKVLIGFLILTFLIMSFTYAYMFAELLKTVNKTYVMLEIFGIMVSIIALMECVYKSQGILFEAKDNDLLFSMPITKKTIMSARLIKLLTFEYIFDVLFFIPAVIVYAILEQVSVTYWISSCIMLLVLPIFPTIIGSIIGYLIRMFSCKFKKEKIIQTIVTIIFMIVIMYVSFNLQNFLINIGSNADTISNILSKVYYPIKLYTSLIQSFNIIDLVILISINIVIFVLFISLFSISYFKIISRSSEVVKNKNYKFKDKPKTQLLALLNKDFKNFFASPVFIVNAGIGLIILVLLSVCICVNFNGTIEFFSNTIMKSEGNINLEDVANNMSLIFLAFLAFVIPLSMISSAIISIEGKSFNLTKTLPISGKKILLSKTLMTDIIIMIPVLVTTVMMAIRFNFGAINTIEIVILSVLLTNITATLGLITNLIFPKMDAKNDTEAVKQNISTFIATFAGFVLFGASVGLCSMFNIFFGFNIAVCIMIAIYIFLNLMNYLILANYGVNRLKKI